MGNTNDSVSNRTFDAIVIGSGISGGWAAKELCEKGLKTLVLERGRDVKHIKDYPTTNMMPWEFKHRGQVPYDIAEKKPGSKPLLCFSRRCYALFCKRYRASLCTGKAF